MAETTGPRARTDSTAAEPIAKQADAVVGPTEFTTLPRVPRGGASAVIAADSGTGDGMTPQNNNAEYGIVRFSSVVPVNLDWPYFPDVTQRMSGRINGTFYVYHEIGHGDDDYLVVYQEDGLVTMAPMISDQQLGRGYFLYRMDTTVTPNLGGDQASWVSSSPATVNQSRVVQDTTVDTFDMTLNLGIALGASKSESTQIWHGFTMKVTDWNIDETSDAMSNACSWKWYQNVPWTGNDKNVGDFGWWQQAYNVGGGWDDVKSLPDLSTNSLQYHASAAWRFPRTLIAADGTLKVTFSGGAMYWLGAIGMPQLGNSGHHMIWWNNPENRWQQVIDLVAEAKLV